MQIRILSYGYNKIETIKLLRELTGFSLKESKFVVDNLPFDLEVEMPEQDLLQYVSAFERLGAKIETAINPFDLNSDTPPQPVPHSKKISLEVELTKSSSQKIALIKLIRSHTGLSLSDIKNMVENTPSRFFIGTEKENIAEIQTAFKQLNAEIKILNLPYSEDHASEPKKTPQSVEGNTHTPSAAPHIPETKHPEEKPQEEKKHPKTTQPQKQPENKTPYIKIIDFPSENAYEIGRIIYSHARLTLFEINNRLKKMPTSFKIKEHEDEEIIKKLAPLLVEFDINGKHVKPPKTEKSQNDETIFNYQPAKIKNGKPYMKLQLTHKGDSRSETIRYLKLFTNAKEAVCEKIIDFIPSVFYVYLPESQFNIIQSMFAINHAVVKKYIPPKKEKEPPPEIKEPPQENIAKEIKENNKKEKKKLEERKKQSNFYTKINHEEDVLSQIIQQKIKQRDKKAAHVTGAVVAVATFFFLSFMNTLGVIFGSYLMLGAGIVMGLSIKKKGKPVFDEFKKTAIWYMIALIFVIELIFFFRFGFMSIFEYGGYYASSTFIQKYVFYFLACYIAGQLSMNKKYKKEHLKKIKNGQVLKSTELHYAETFNTPKKRLNQKNDYEKKRKKYIRKEITNRKNEFKNNWK